MRRPESEWMKVWRYGYSLAFCGYSEILLVFWWGDWIGREIWMGGLVGDLVGDLYERSGEMFIWDIW